MNHRYDPYLTGHVRIVTRLLGLPIFVPTPEGADHHREIHSFFDECLYVPVRFTEAGGDTRDGWASSPALRIAGNPPGIQRL